MNLSFRMSTPTRPRIPISYIIQQVQEHSRKQEPVQITSKELEPTSVSVVEEPEPVVVQSEEPDSTTVVEESSELIEQEEVTV